MTLKDYDKAMQLANVMHCRGMAMIDDSRRLEDLIDKLAGITEMNREPGMARWHIEGVQRAFNHPREALIAKLEANKS